MKRIGLFLLVGLVMLAGCRDKELDMTLVEKTLFEQMTFEQIEVKDGWTVQVIQDDQKKGVELQYSAFLEDYLAINWDGSKLLKIGFTQSLYLPASTVMNATVYVRSLESVSLEDASTMTIQGEFTEEEGFGFLLKDASTLKGGSFHGGVFGMTVEDVSKVADVTAEGEVIRLELHEAAVIKGTFTANENFFVIASAASLLTTYGGSAKEATLLLTEACNLNMLQTPVTTMQIHVVDACEASVNVTNFLYGDIINSSKVYYQGTPTLDVSCDETSIIRPL